MELNNRDDIHPITETSADLADKEVSLQMRKPKKVLHFSDGTLEEYSDEDEVDEMDGQAASCNGSLNENENVDEKTLAWIPWIKLKSWRTGYKALAGVDYVGGALASFLGITTPKYVLEYEAFKKHEEEKVEIEKEKFDNLSWEHGNNNEQIKVITTDVKNDSSNKF